MRSLLLVALSVTTWVSEVQVLLLLLSIIFVVM